VASAIPIPLDAHVGSTPQGTLESAVSDADLTSTNRVMLAHFDSYSTALVFAKWGDTLLYPAALPEGATLGPGPDTVGPANDIDAVMAETVARLSLNAAEMRPARDFNHWADTEAGPVRIHLLRFDTFEAPKDLIAPHGGVFKPISELRGSDRTELLLAREVFNLIIGAGGGRA